MKPMDGEAERSGGDESGRQLISGPGYVAVYGTLLSGHRGQFVCPEPLDHLIGEPEPALIRGRLWDVGVGYPGLTEGPDLVRAELWKITGEPELALGTLDHYESCGPGDRGEYERRVIEARMTDGTTRQAWCYFYLDPTSGLTEIDDGDWVAYSLRLETR